MIQPAGGPLTPADFKSLGARWIDRKTAQAQLLRRVVSIEGTRITGRNGAGKLRRFTDTECLAGHRPHSRVSSSARFP
jgi:hypothetical protein